MDCVKTQAKTIRTPRTAFGGSLGDTPRVTYAIIAVCVMVFVGQIVLPNDQVGDYLAFAPFLAQAEPWRFVTAAFVHSTGNVLHLGINMYLLWQLGSELERHLGWSRYLATYLLSALGASGIILLLASPSGTPGSSWLTGTIGASGAVLGVMGALIAVNHKQGRDTRTLWIWIGIITVMGLLPGRNVSWQGHLGGLVLGLACGAVLAYAPASRRTSVQVAGLLVLLALLVLVTAAKLVTAQGYLV